MEKSGASSDKIAEALKMLDEAAKNKKQEIQDMLTDKYKDLKETITGFDSKQSVESVKKTAADAANKAKELGEEKVKEIATQVDQNVHANPWPYIGGAAFCSLLLGFILGKKD